jgi:hypothetical protein
MIYTYTKSNVNLDRVAFILNNSSLAAKYNYAKYIGTTLSIVTNSDLIVPTETDILDNLINRDRGDLILSGISFEELASLYSNSKLGIIASKFDHWQPGGITSIVESLACNAISLCNSGGEIEKEFSHLTFSSKYSDPLFYFNYPEKGSLKKNVIDLLNKSEEDLSKLKSNSCEFACEVLNMNTIGISKLESLIRNFLK